MPTDKNYINSLQKTDAENKKKEQLNKAIETCFNYLKIEDQPKKSDVIFILGSASIEPAKKAAELYKEGFAPKIAFISTSGTFGGYKIWEMMEHEKYKEVLLGLGIPEDSILVKGLTSNTLAEAQVAIPFLKEYGINPKKIILVARPFHQRRAFATFIQQHPDIKYLNCPADEKTFNMSNLEDVKKMVGEIERLLNYSIKGDIQKQEIPDEVLRAVIKIKTELIE